jgi:DNA modification methylase
MKPTIEIDGAVVFLGDCRDVLKTLPDNSVDSVVTDPPYELGFMGKKWDSSGIAYDVTVWEECLRVLKPGGHVLAFGGSRTWHRLAVAVEDAGFELRDSIAWIYGSGFPKSLDVSKAIDKNLGAEREAVVEVSEDLLGEHENPKIVTRTGKEAGTYGAMTGVSPQTHASSSEAKTWQGWGTALKPAFEPVVVGRKPLVGTVAENVLAWGVGGLNIDGSRIGNSGGTARDGKADKPNDSGWENMRGHGIAELNAGRWPANVILDEVTAGLLDEQSGVSKPKPGRTGRKGGNGGALGEFAGSSPDAIGVWPEDVGGGASRFFYVAKASKRDRNEGLEELDSTEAKRTMSGGEDTRGRPVPTNRNFHPTVKPTQLMRYLIKLVTPAGGTVLDPFTGSGSTGKAALLDGFNFIGAELTEEYLPIIEGRLTWATQQQHEGTLF